MLSINIALKYFSNTASTKKYYQKYGRKQGEMGLILGLPPLEFPGEKGVNTVYGFRRGEVLFYGIGGFHLVKTHVVFWW